MSKTAANNDAAHGAAPEQGGRSIMRLVALFVIAFILATVFQIKAHHDSAVRNILGAQRSTAGLIAERVNTNIAAAVGASAGAVELARSGGGADAMSLAHAASLVPPAVAAAVVNRGRDMEAITDNARTALVMAALATASQSSVWTGAPNTGELPSAPTIVRRIGDRAVVTVLDPAGLLPDLEANARVLIAAPSGQVIFASPALREAGLRTQQQLVASTQRNPNAGAMLSDSNGGSWSAAEAIAPLGEFRVIVAAPAPTPLSLWLEALFRFAILAAAPMAAVGVLYILQRQNLQRARLAEAEAERAETHSKITADGAKIGLLEWRPDVDEVQLSEQAVRLLGAMGDTLGLREFLDLILTEDRFAVDEEFRRARQSGLLDARFRVTRGGNVAWIEARGTALGNASGSEPRLFCSVVDVTQRYEAEARVSRLERQLRAAIESFSGPFALWDSRRRLLLWNQSFARTFDLGPELLRPRASYEAIAAASTARIRREKHDTSDPDVRVVELTSGDWLHIVERRAADGGVITVGVDITPLKRKEEELARNERRLQDALGRAESQEYRIKQLAREAHEERLKAEDASRAKSAFLANMSHELRTPLNAVIGFSEIMAKELFGPLQNDQYKQYSHDIYDSGNHLLDLINDILDMAKIEAGKLTLSPRPLDPSVAIEQAVRLTKRKAEEKSLSIVVDAENLPEIEADHRAVKQMLLNLLSNAVKFTDSGAIMVHARPNAEGLTLRVVDTGCGIPPEHLPRLAQPFQQVETELTRNNHGTGLGLALTKSLAEMHGGKLTIQSEVGRGTIVTITLPRQFGGGQTAEATAAE
ncbi:histidine kinase sensor protein [alpha proteobacterium U9-1i]|nr:histidine kinase sensor protein [alpha proteobacterium U9-1i]